MIAANNPGSVHDSTLLQSSPIFHEIESGHALPHNVLTFPGYEQIPLGMVGDSAFPSRPGSGKLQLLKQGPAYKKEGPDRNKGSNQQ